MKQLDMFGTEEEKPSVNDLPNLSTFNLHTDVFALDTETTGLEIWGDSVPVGLSVAGPGIVPTYLPWGHKYGPNLNPEKVREWAIDNFNNKDIYMMNAKFDIHMLYKWGLDLEAMNCRVHDVSHMAALLDEKRRHFNLNALAQDYLKKEKIKLPDDGRAIHERSYASIRAYAENDAYLTWELYREMQDEIQKQDLRRVLELEDNLIYSTCEMERNGAPIDTGKLEEWLMLTEKRYNWIILELYKIAKLKVNPSSPKDLARLFTALKIPFNQTVTGLPSFTWDVLKRAAKKHKAVELAMEGRQLASLRSKYLEKYAKAIDSKGILRYNLHQLRSDEYGTVTGRYSSSRVNIQQVFSEGRQAGGALERYLIRELFIPESGKQWVSADASQIEFRIFAHYSSDYNIINAFRQDPHTDFHEEVAKLTHLSRMEAKHINFGRLYGMGLEKMKSQMKLRSDNRELTDDEIERMYRDYDERFGAVKYTLQRAARLATDRGWVRTNLGRRRRYTADDKSHSALNAVIQGTAADIMKMKILEVYNSRKDLDITIRFTVHDELDGDLSGDPNRLQKFLDQQSIDLKVPILWDVKTGENWAIKK